MGIQVLPREPGMGAALGGQLGEGVSEQLPESFKQGSISKGLRQLGQQQNGPTDPLTLTSQLMGIPGMDAKTAQKMMPMLQQQLANQQMMGDMNPQTTAKGSNVPPTDNEIISQETEGPQVMGPGEDAADLAVQNYKTGEGSSMRNTSPSYGTPIDPNSPEFDKRVTQRFQRSPARFGFDYNKARQEELEADQQRAQSQQLQQKNLEQIDQKIDQAAEATGAAEALPAEILSRFKDQAHDAYEQGKLNPTQAGDKYRREATDFVKNRNRMTNTGSWMKRMFQGKRVKENLDNLRNQYEKHNLLDAFKNDLISYHGMSAPYAAFMAYPPDKEPADLKKYINDLPRISTGEGKFTNMDEIARGVAKRWADNVHPHTVALQLKSKGYDPNQFISQMQDLTQDGTFKPSGDAQKDLEQMNFVPGLSDMLMRTFAGGPEKP